MTVPTLWQGGPLEFAVASYLIVATAGTTLSVSNGW